MYSKCRKGECAYVDSGTGWSKNDMRVEQQKSVQ